MFQLGSVLLVLSVIVSYVVVKTSMNVDEKMINVRKANVINMVNSKKNIDSIYTQSYIDSKEKIINIKVSDMITDIDNRERDMIDRFQNAIEIAIFENGIEKPNCSNIVSIYKDGKQLLSREECENLISMKKDFIEFEDNQILLSNNSDEVIKSLKAQYDVSGDNNQMNINNSYSFESKKRNTEKIKHILESSRDIMSAIAERDTRIRSNIKNLNMNNNNDNMDDSIKLSSAIIRHSVKYTKYAPTETSNSIKHMDRVISKIVSHNSRNNQNSNYEAELNSVKDIKNTVESYQNVVSNITKDQYKHKDSNNNRKNIDNLSKKIDSISGFKPRF